MTNAADDKRILRQTLRQIRQAIPHAIRGRAAHAVARQINRCPPLRRARRIAVYLSMGSELCTVPLIATLQANGVAVFAPALTRGGMRFRPFDARTLWRHPLGMQQPRTGVALRASAMDVVMLPLLGFDRLGTRLGQGGGYYDRALSRCRFRPWRIGLGYAAQQVEALPREPWDQRLHAVLTERGLRRFSRH